MFWLSNKKTKFSLRILNQSPVTVWHTKKAAILLQNLRAEENIINELTSNLQHVSMEK